MKAAVLLQEAICKERLLCDCLTQSTQLCHADLPTLAGVGQGFCLLLGDVPYKILLLNVSLVGKSLVSPACACLPILLVGTCHNLSHAIFHPDLMSEITAEL